MSELRTSYEFIVVGAGSAGSVVASGLAESGASVLLLETGAVDSSPAIHDPRRSHELWHADEDWNYRTVPQAGLGGRSVHWPRGRVLGGSSSINGMIFVRGCRADFDAWAEVSPGWGYDDVLPVFKEIEAFDAVVDETRGDGGPLPVMSRYQPHVVHEAIVESAQGAGLAFNPDYNGGELDGVSFMQFTIRDGRRISAARAFLGERRPASLDIRTGVRCRRLVLEGDACVGVECVVEGRTLLIRASREIVLSAGVVGSPQLLMLSGIGPADHLREVGVTPVAHLPGVGQNLHDHAVCPVIFKSSRPIPEGLPGLPEMQSHLFWRSRPGLPGPDVQPIHFTTPRYEPWMSGPAEGITLHGGIIRPASTGSLTLRSADPSDPPDLDPAYLTAPEDLEAMVASIELNRAVARQSPLREWIEEELYPGPGVTGPAALREYIRRALGSYHHQVGTCRMGTDPMAVVDPQLRVHGIDGLRVADASVMPRVTSGNTNAPTVMIGARAAALIGGA